MEIKTENGIKFFTSTAKIVSRKMEVFYNPIMKTNRDFSILLLKCIDKKNLQIADAFAGTGIRSIRFLTELSKDKIGSVYINDISQESYKIIKKNIRLNESNLISKKYKLDNLDANIFLHESFGFDYIDIDPFGSPNSFLDSAMKRISREGIIAVTATDTAPLCGTYPKTCKRKYWSAPIRNEHMHEIGLRILIKKVQLIGAQFEKALIPVFSYYKDHYFRAYFIAKKSKTKADNILSSHQYFHYCDVCTNFFVSKDNSSICCNKITQTAGPIWTGQINDIKLLKKMQKKCKDKKNKEFINLLINETMIKNVCFYDIHKIVKKHNIKTPKTNELIEKINDLGYKTALTHFNIYGIKTNMKFKEFIKVIHS